MRESDAKPIHPTAHGIHALIVAANKGDVSGAASMDAEMIAQLQSEAALPEEVADRDYQGKIRRLAIERLLAAVEASKKSG